MKTIEVAIAIVFRDGKILITRRKADTPLGGYWEFPGGKCEVNESPEVCALRELREEVCIVARITQSLEIIEHHYPHARVRIHPFICQHEEGEAQLVDVVDARWIEPGSLLTYQFPEANAALNQSIVDRFSIKA